jgi:hypothetical protein
MRKPKPEHPEFSDSLPQLIESEETEPSLLDVKRVVVHTSRQDACVFTVLAEHRAVHDGVAMPCARSRMRQPFGNSFDIAN